FRISIFEGLRAFSNFKCFDFLKSMFDTEIEENTKTPH
ncbi:MAG: hypothetical protein ACI8RD_013661, partial [Bacillariaceae sp.]